MNVDKYIKKVVLNTIMKFYYGYIDEMEDVDVCETYMDEIREIIQQDVQLDTILNLSSTNSSPSYIKGIEEIVIQRLKDKELSEYSFYKTIRREKVINKLDVIG